MQKKFFFYCNCNYNRWPGFYLLHSSKFNQYVSITSTKLFSLCKPCKISKPQQTILAIHRKMKSKCIPFTEFPWKLWNIKALIFSYLSLYQSGPTYNFANVIEHTVENCWNDKIDIWNLFFLFPKKQEY